MISVKSTRHKQVVLAAFVVALSISANAQQPPDVLQRPVPSFNAERISRIDAALKLGKELHLPLGIEYAGATIFEVINVRSGPTHLGVLIEKLLPAKAGFRVSVQDGVLVVSHKDLLQGYANLLDTRFRELTIPESTLQEASLLLQMELAKQLKPGLQGWAGSYDPGLGKVRVGPLNLRNVTVRGALNQLVAQHGAAAWLIRVQPKFLNELQSSGLWIVAEYDNLPEGLGQILHKYILPDR